MGLINDLAELALATRLKRLSDRLASDVNRVYKELNLNFESKWFLVLELLKKEKQMSIVDIADALQLTHPAIVQFVDQLLLQDLVTVQKDTKDARKRLISLSAKGQQLLHDLLPVLDIIRTANEEFLRQADHNILNTLGQLERALDKQSMYDRVKAKLAAQNARVVK